MSFSLSIILKELILYFCKVTQIKMHINYLPSIGYFQKMLANDNVVLHLADNYIRKSLRNRTYILGANGKLILSIPTTKLGDESRLFENIELSYAENWQKQHWKSIESAYRRSPYFEFYEDYFMEFYNKQEYKYLWELNYELILLIIKLLKIDKSVLLEKEELIKSNNEYNLIKACQYQQVFVNKLPFVENLSIIDLIFNKGPQSIMYL